MDERETARFKPKGPNKNIIVVVVDDDDVVDDVVVVVSVVVVVVNDVVVVDENPHGSIMMQPNTINKPHCQPVSWTNERLHGSNAKEQNKK